MVTGIRETAANCPFTIDYEKVLEIQQQPWTIRTLGIEPQGDTSFTKIDFEQALKKVSRRVKK